MTSLTRWFDRWVHPEALSGPALVLHRVRTQVVVAWVGVWSFTLAALMTLVTVPAPAAWALTLTYLHSIAGCAGVLLLQRVTPRHEISGNLLAFVSFAFGASVLALTGGIESPALFWMPMTPLVAFVTVGWRSATAWLGLSMSVYLGVFLAQTAGYVFPDLLLGVDEHWAAFANVTASSVLVFAIAFTWDRGQRMVVDDLQAARDVARSADQAKSNVVAIVSHELRTPMNGVLGMLDLLSDTDLDDTQMRYADTARGAARSLLDILDDLLDRSRIDAGRLGLDDVPFRMNEVLEDVQNLVDLGGFGRAVPVRFEVGDAMDWLITGDPRRVRQVVTNLVGNALKFTEDGEVVVRAHGEPVGDHMRCYIEVSDTGIGIPPERMPHVFDAFTQVDGSITRRFGGTGLGLSITRDLVNLMGGTIEVDSRVGDGTTFYVQLPLPVAVGTVPDEPTDPGMPRLWYGGVRVLVAEDNAVNQLVIKGYLQRHGVEPVLVADGEQAVFAALEQPFDLVLMDIEMPVMDGFRATRVLREHGHDVPIVALTAHASSKVRARCIAAGMDGFLSKPIATGAMVKVLFEFVGSRLDRVADMSEEHTEEKTA